MGLLVCTSKGRADPSTEPALNKEQTTGRGLEPEAEQGQEALCGIP